MPFPRITAQDCGEGYTFETLHVLFGVTKQVTKTLRKRDPVQCGVTA